MSVQYHDKPTSVPQTAFKIGLTEGIEDVQTHNAIDFYTKPPYNQS
jgi:hypothetical protein